MSTNTSQPYRILLAALTFLTIANASSTNSPTRPAALAAPSPLITLAVVPTRPTRTYKYRRDIISDLSNDVSSILGDLGSAIPSYVASGIPNFFQDFPSGSAVASSLGLGDGELAALPTMVLNLPPYANWTDQGWNVRFHGNVYKQPNISQSKLDDLANGFLIGTSVQSLPASQASMARNLTAEIFVVQQDNVQPVFLLQPSTTASGAAQAEESLTAPYNTTAEGDYDFFHTIPQSNYLAGNATTQIQTLPISVQGATDSSNATAYLVPPTGLTIISDIDDILRVTKIYEPKEGLLNSFAKPFTPWLNMPSIYANWSRTLTSPAVHFHYLTTTPEQVTRNYESFIFSTYPAGSFDTRPLNFSNIAETLSVRLYLLRKIFATFPDRKFILVGDVSNSDIMKDYPMLATTTDQVQCIFLRNTTGTDTGDKFPYDTSGFKGLDQSKYMFFLTPDDLSGLDIANGQCYNTSVPQNVTYGYQGLLFGQDTAANSSANGTGNGGVRAVAVGGYAPWMPVTVAFALAVGGGLWGGV